MNAKKYLYAAVGAPVAVAKVASERVNELRDKLTSNALDLSREAQKQFDEWAAEGEKLISRLSEGKVVDELAAKVDFDQMQEQVSRLRDQLEEMLNTWRANFRPEKAEAPKEEAAAETAPAAEATAAKKTTTAKKPAAKKTTTAKKPAAKKTTTAKKPAAKKTTTAEKAAAGKTGETAKAS